MTDPPVNNPYSPREGESYAFGPTPETPKAPPVGDPGVCRSCGAAIVWTITKAGKRSPVDPDGTTHFATCPQGKEWSRKGKRE